MTSSTTRGYFYVIVSEGNEAGDKRTEESESLDLPFPPIRSPNTALKKNVSRKLGQKNRFFPCR